MATPCSLISAERALIYWSIMLFVALYVEVLLSGVCLGGAPSTSTDILMDLLSIGSTPVQNGPPTSNFIPPGIETKSVAVTPQVVDILDGLSSSTSLPG